MKPIKQLKIKKGMKIVDLIDNMSGTAFNGKALSNAVSILKQALKEKDCKKFVGIAGALVPGGMKQIIIDMINNKMVDVLVITGANLTHDLIESLGFNHYQIDDFNDKELNKKGFDRIYNVVMKNEVYQKLEQWFVDNFDELNADSNTEFLNNIGKILIKQNKNINSIFAACFKNKIPLFCPALSDSGIGLMIWGMMTRNKKPKMNEYNDLHKMLDIAWISKNKSVFYIGGGTPKNYIQQAMQFSNPAKFGVQIKIDNESYGGSSGAPLKEGISWGKMLGSGKFVDVNCDATIALPLIYASLI